MEGINKQETIPVEDTNAAAISYLWIMSIFVYAAKRKTPFIRFHAAQASALFVLSVLFWFIPLINTGLELIIGLFMVIGFYKASTGAYFHLPFISPLVFSDNPIRTAVHKIGKSFQYLYLLVRTKLSDSKEIKQQLEKIKSELLKTPVPASATLQDIQHNSDIAAFSYLWILSIILYEFNEGSEYVSFHARQGVILFVLSVLFAAIPTIGFYLNVLVLLACVLGFVMALSGSMYQIPLIGYIAEKCKTFEDFYLDVKAAIAYVFHVLSRSMTGENQENFVSLRARLKQAYDTKKGVYQSYPREGKDIAAASYIFFGPLMWLLHKRKPFVLFHARQATLLLIFFLALYLFSPLRWLSLLPLAMMLLGFIESSRSRYYAMPFVYDVVSSRVTMKDIIHAFTFCIHFLGNLGKRLFTSEKKQNLQQINAHSKGGDKSPQEDSKIPNEILSSSLRPSQNDKNISNPLITK